MHAVIAVFLAAVMCGISALTVEVFHMNKEIAEIKKAQQPVYPQMTEAQMKELEEADNAATESFNGVLATLHDFMTDGED